MQNVLIAGAGKIGTLIAFLLANAKDYQVYLADVSFANHPDLDRMRNQVQQLNLVELDIQNTDVLEKFLKANTMAAVISALPYFHNISLAKIAKKFQLHYFDLTEDTHTADTILELSKDSTHAFVPQSGFISIVANHIMQHFNTLDTVKMRVGALPINISNALQYSLTWSTDGLINEYGNMCYAIVDGKVANVLPLDDLEEIKIDGLTYEAFNTSGGIGTLAQTYFGKVKNMGYKTIRYPGHCEKVHFLMNDLKLNEDRETLKKIFERSLPRTEQDEVLVYVSVIGLKEGSLREENFVKKFYPKKINDIAWSAIQLTTACSLCSIFDIIMQEPKKYRGLIRQEEFSLETFTQNRFGEYYA
jgi:saccharopine dehydrogenase-like NADP-dependent oxidoreductase